MIHLSCVEEMDRRHRRIGFEYGKRRMMKNVLRDLGEGNGSKDESHQPTRPSRDSWLLLLLLLSSNLEITPFDPPSSATNELDLVLLLH